MKVSEFIEWLKTQPQNANVEVVNTGYACYEISAWWDDFNPEEDSKVIDGCLRIGVNADDC